jgi:predicted nucleic acid-binding protein
VASLDDALSGISKLGFDTSAFVYYVERNPAYVALVREVLRRLNAGQFTGHTSVITLTEVLTYPKRIQNSALEQSYRLLLLNSRNIETHNTDSAIAGAAANLRARYNLRTPDAIQIATALQAGCEAFLTNDLRVGRVTELRVLVLDELTL